MEFSKLEKAALAAILSQPVEGMEVVRTQFAAASVAKRDYSGVGFFTEISVPPSVAPIPSSKELHDALFYGAIGRAKSDPEGWVFFILWTDEGHLACLEGWTVRDAWPNEDEIEGIQSNLLWTEDGYLASPEGYTVRDARPNEDERDGIQPS